MDYFGVDKAVAVRFVDSLNRHLQYVREAGARLGIPVDILAEHDASKFSVFEFPGYARHFQGGGDPDAFSKAWLHHIHANPHHWQHWIFSDGWMLPGSQIENGVLPMPGIYVKEMVADWQGAQMAYTGTWDMSGWLIANMPKIRIHSQTAQHLREELDHLGYTDIVYTCKFAGEDRPA